MAEFPPGTAATADAVVVGAGPAGSSAALELARAGRRVVLVERGPFPGSKNVYGGVVYPRVLDRVLPGWWDTVPVQRWVVRRSTMLMTPGQALAVEQRTETWGRPPYNGMTTYRADFDRWLADRAVEAGAVLVPSTVVTGLLRDRDGRVTGVRTDRPGGELAARVVIAADGVNSLLAKELGLLPAVDPAGHTLGVKQVLSLPAGTIEDRFNVGPGQGVDIEMLGCTGPVPGGGFLYTNTDTVAVGVVLGLTGLARSGIRPEQLVEDLEAHPAIAPYLRGATLREYSAHLIPEGGYRHMPALAADGFLVAGDAAGMTLAAGLWLEGVNFAIGAGLAAGRAAARAIAAGDVSRRGLAGYRAELESTFVLADHRRLRHAPGLLLSDRVQRSYPGLVNDLVEGLFTVTNPVPKPGLTRLARAAARRHGIGLRQLAADGLRALRTFR